MQADDNGFSGTGFLDTRSQSQMSALSAAGVSYDISSSASILLRFPEPLIP